jgi:IS30 family transposase
VRQARAGQDTLELEWSPEQIAAHLRQADPDRPAWHLCHETIYRALDEVPLPRRSRTEAQLREVEAEMSRPQPDRSRVAEHLSRPAKD